MTDTIERLCADLAEAGKDPDQVQSAGSLGSWDEGTYVCESGDQGIVVRHLGQAESDDRVDVFDSEAEAVAELRRRLFSSTRAVGDTERAAIRERMRKRAEETLAKLEAGHD